MGSSARDRYQSTVPLTTAPRARRRRDGRAREGLAKRLIGSDGTAGGSASTALAVIDNRAIAVRNAYELLAASTASSIHRPTT